MSEKNNLNKTLVILAVALAIAMAYFIFFPAKQGNTATDGRALVWEIVSTGTTGNGDVEIALTPLSFDKGQLKVQISANTHSVELGDFDLKENTQLLYGDKTLKPTTAPKLSGHHSSGMLIFNVDGSLDKFKILINGIPKVENRVFSW